MEEKTIIKSENRFAKKLRYGFGILLAVVAVLAMLAFVTGRKSEKLLNSRDVRIMHLEAEYKLESEKYESDAYESYDGSDETGLDIDGYEKWMAGDFNPDEDDQVIALEKKSEQMKSVSTILKAATVVLAVLDAVLLILFLAVKDTSLTVTDKRVYGKAAFGKRVDLPLDMISAVAISPLSGIAIGTSSGRIKFVGVDHRDEIHKVISDLMIGRQKAPRPAETPAAPVIPQSNADELRKYKALLDDGIITQEEFDAKKKQLLGL